MATIRTIGIHQSPCCHQHHDKAQAWKQRNAKVDHGTPPSSHHDPHAQYRIQQTIFKAWFKAWILVLFRVNCPTFCPDTAVGWTVGPTSTIWYILSFLWMKQWPRAMDIYQTTSLSAYRRRGSTLQEGGTAVEASGYWALVTSNSRDRCKPSLVSACESTSLPTSSSLSPSQVSVHPLRHSGSNGG